jgi:hypothetical protein
MVGSQDSTVGIATGYRLDNRQVGVRISVGSEIFSASSRPALGSIQSIQWVPEGLSPEVMWPGHEADHSLPASAKVKKIWIHTSPPHSPSWHSAELVKHRDNFNLLGKLI